MATTSPRLRILFTEGSSTSARMALYGLGPRHTIDVLDAGRLGQCRFSRFVRRWIRGPALSRDPAGYLETVRRLVRTGEYDVLFPTHEQVYLLSRFRTELRRHVGLAVPEFDVLDRLMSKAHFARLVAELGLDQPAVRIVRSREELLATDQFPCFVKLDYSTAGEGVRHVRDRAELLRAADAFDQAGWLGGQAEVLVQQPAAGTKAAVSGIFQHGRLVAAHFERGRALGVGGSSMAQLSLHCPVAVAALARIGERLRWHGAMVIECFTDEAGQRVELIECNPRIGETLNALLCGVNFCEQLVRVSLDEEVEPQIEWRAGVRTHQGFLALMARALAGASRRQLLGELTQILRGRGLYENSEDELTRPRDDWLSLFPFLGVTALLLARPRAAQWLVTKTVQGYSLHQSATARIRAL